MLKQLTELVEGARVVLRVQTAFREDAGKIKAEAGKSGSIARIGFCDCLPSLGCFRKLSLLFERKRICATRYLRRSDRNDDNNKGENTDWRKDDDGDRS